MRDKWHNQLYLINLHKKIADAFGIIVHTLNIFEVSETMSDKGSIDKR